MDEPTGMDTLLKNRDLRSLLYLYMPEKVVRQIIAPASKTWYQLIESDKAPWRTIGWNMVCDRESIQQFWYRMEQNKNRDPGDILIFNIGKPGSRTLGELPLEEKPVKSLVLLFAAPEGIHQVASLFKEKPVGLDQKLEITLEVQGDCEPLEWGNIDIFAKFPPIHRLSLNGCSGYLSYLPSLHGLTSLTMDAGMDDQAYYALKNFTELEYLWVDLEDGADTIFKEKVIHNKLQTLRCHDLSSWLNHLTCPALHTLTVDYIEYTHKAQPFLKEHGSIETVEISGNITMVEVNAMFPKVKTLRLKHIFGQPDWSDILGLFPNLTELLIHDPGNRLETNTFEDLVRQRCLREGEERLKKLTIETHWDEKKSGWCTSQYFKDCPQVFFALVPHNEDPCCSPFRGDMRFYEFQCTAVIMEWK